MRIRTIKPEFFEDEKLASLPPHARLLFIGLWGLADKNGVLEDRPTWIKAKIFPYEEGDTVDVSRLLPHLVTGRHLVRYVVDGRPLLMIRNFAKHQRITGKEGEGAGRYPMPPLELWNGDTTGTQPGHTGDDPGAQEREREQGTGKGNGDACAPDPDPDDIGTPPAIQPPAGTDADAWRFGVSSEPWARSLIKIAKIGPKNWTAWKALVETHGLPAVESAVRSIPASERWPDAVTESLAKSRGQANPADVIAHRIHRMVL